MSAPAIARAIDDLAADRRVSAEAAEAAVLDVVGGQATEVQITAFLTALRLRGETAEVLAGAIRAVRQVMTPLEVPETLRPLLDTCGTGGDGARTLNISTAAAIVSAACGIRVAKHGNRSASGNCGSAEVLGLLGLEVDPGPEAVARTLYEHGIGFLFAPRFHPALKLAAPVRKQLPFRTLFNLVGPLANPTAPEFQLLGVPSEPTADLIATALARLQVRRAAVVTGSDGLDEVTLSGPTRVRLVERGSVCVQVWTPDDFGLPIVTADQIRVDGPEDAALAIRRILGGDTVPGRAVVSANVAACLWLAGRVATLREGVREAEEAIDSGRAAGLLERWAAATRVSP